MDGRINGVRVVLKEKKKHVNSVLEVRVSDKVMCLKMETDRVVMNIINACALQVRWE